ncbi:Gp138 family membrane-puncturing spike protein [Bordetella petrii]|uniref:Bacteriophage protein n=1 Tax=Bordetella petrii (strain ATCC BAA-461 / DSM 12804 / CCUG 43448 / CIP 107267 / Se-1111R) TaxID=340100 RepID=A9I944_BORPD|nr:Gp138 family membrane-puncturing spike protein [Bordetella petrii]CAP41326.1 putative bacteriophage protein [Bordetella petrii]
MTDPVTDLRRLIAAELAEVHTTLPGVVVAYDGKMAVVRPALPKQLANGQVLPAPQIVSVPVCWPVGDVAGALALISVPLKAGDPVVLHFSERALESWLAGSDEPPDDPRQFDLTDCFAAPVMRPGAAAADTENLSIQYGPGTVKLSPAGDLTMNVKRWTVNMEQGTFNGPLLVNGLLAYTQGMTGEGGEGSTIKITGDVKFEGGGISHNGKNIGDSHRHPYDGGITDPPQ